MQTWNSSKRSSVISQKPIPETERRLLQRGDTVAYLDDAEIRETSFLCSSDGKGPRFILTELLTTEDDLKCFCQTNNLATNGLNMMVLEAFEYLNTMTTIQKLATRVDNTETRKRQIPLATSILPAKRTTPPGKRSQRILPKPKETVQPPPVDNESENYTEIIEMDDRADPDENVKIETIDQVSSSFSL